jgi:hypothetical protein
VDRPVDAPDQVYSSARQAAKWLGLSLSAFRREAEQRPELLPAARFGRGVRYHWMDLITYAHVRQRLPPQE